MVRIVCSSNVIPDHVVVPVGSWSLNLMRNCNSAFKFAKALEVVDAVGVFILQLRLVIATLSWRPRLSKGVRVLLCLWTKSSVPSLCGVMVVGTFDDE